MTAKEIKASVESENTVDSIGVENFEISPI